MDKLSAIVVATAIIWAAEIIAISIILAGTPYFGPLLPIIAGGAAVNIIIVASARIDWK